MYNWICEVIYLCKMQCGLTQPCRLYALCLITGITDIKCYWWFRFYTPVFCWRLSLKTKEAAGLKDRVASAWVWCVEGCRSAWVWCVEGHRCSRRKPLVWRTVSWVPECGVLKAVGEAEGSRWSEGPCLECLSVVCWRLSVKLKEAAGLKDHIMSNVSIKKNNLDSLQPKLNSVLMVTSVHIILQLCCSSLMYSYVCV